VVSFFVPKTDRFRQEVVGLPARRGDVTRGLCEGHWVVSALAGFGAAELIADLTDLFASRHGSVVRHGHALLGDAAIAVVEVIEGPRERVEHEGLV
jgi:hypothetical protein